jgi:hypothetical protein
MVAYTVLITRSPNRLKKFRAVVTDGTRTTSVDFGQAGASDYTIHKEFPRMVRYVTRHSHPSDLEGVRNIERVNSTKERWGIDGIRTAGFWSRWLLWSRPSLRGAARGVESKFRSVRIRLDLNG